MVSLMLGVLQIVLLFLSAATSMPDPCYPSPCGSHTQCFVREGRPVCSCLPGHHGNPLVACERGECVDNRECPPSKACRLTRCVDPCIGQCGINANCNVRNHVAVCSCPRNYKGDPFTSCRRMDPEELCNPSPCGTNTKCEVIDGVPTCSCLPGYRGQPLIGCKHECESNDDCDSSQTCKYFKCVHVCQEGACGVGAICEASNHRPVCRCPENYSGDPFLACRPECLVSEECPSQSHVCRNNKCIDLCKGVCGENANCKIRDGRTAICSCPRGMTGNPFVKCRPLGREDLCNPNPCGENALCTVGLDHGGNDRSVCTCPRGYVGDPLESCTKGSCVFDKDCPSDEMCNKRYECVNPCISHCGTGAVCQAHNHAAVCSCPPGTSGNALLRCYSLSNTSYRASYYKK